MNAHTSFDHLLAVLTNHLPHVVLDGPVTITRDALRVDGRGISVGDVAQLINDISGVPDFLPTDIPVDAITLRDLVLQRSADPVQDFDLEFVLAWGTHEITVPDSFPLRMATAQFVWENGGLSADATATLLIEDMVLSARLEMPSQIVSLRLSPDDAETVSPFLARRGLVRQDGAHKLHYMALTGSVLYRRFIARVELRDVLTIGPVHLAEAAGELDLSAAGSGSRFAASARVEIATGGGDHVDLAVGGEVDSHGWKLTGEMLLTGKKVSAAALVTEAARALKKPAPVLPPAIADLTLRRLALSVDTHDDSFVLDCSLDWPGSSAVFALHLEKHATEGLLVSGTLALGDVHFNVTFDTRGTPVLVGVFEAAGAQPLTLDRILEAAGLDVDAALGAGGTGITFSARAVGVALDSEQRLLLAAAVDAGIDLSRLGDLPVLGALMPDANPIGLSIRPYFMSEGFGAEAGARQHLPASLGLSGGALGPGFNLSAELNLGGLTHALPDVQLQPGPQAIASSRPKPPGAPASPAPPRADLAWSDVDTSVGPLHIARVGWALNDNKDVIDVAFDGDLSIAGLTLSMDGLGATYAFKDQHLTPHLQGLGLDFRKGPVNIGGAFLNSGGDFAGKLMVGTPKFSLSALGAFTMIEDTPSMFLFGVLGMPLGGPAFFFVEGLSAGFGVHRKLHMPAIEDVRAFPLIAAAAQTSVGAPPDPDPSAQLRALHSYVEPKLGSYFLAAGIKFNSFRLLHGNLVAIVSFGRDFEIDVVGTADFSTPPDLPAGTPAMARIQLDLTARFAPAEGLIAVEARLNPKSYVYGPLCHLSGGFAFYAWTSGQHAGDFVLSVGGYNPHFDVPDHYPSVPRMTLNYQVSEEVYLKGDAYFAMTPSVMMAGGGLHANAKIGALHAWADFTLDMLVRWEPFHYEAWMHIGIGAQWKCFHTTASADLHIQGPDFSGTANVEWFVFSFSINFGPSTLALPLPVSFDAFQRRFLGYDGSDGSLSDMLGIVISKGVIGEQDGVAIVAGSKLEIQTSTRIPLTRAQLGNSDSGLRAPETLGIAPMAQPDMGLSLHRITISRDGGKNAEVLFVIDDTAQTSQVPAALWGKTFTVDQNTPPRDAAVGVTLRPATHIREGAWREVAAAKFRMADAGQPVHAPAFRHEDAVIVAPPVAPPPKDSRFRVGLTLIGPNKIGVIKEIRAITGLGLKEAKDLVETAGIIAEALTSAEADSIEARMTALGATTERTPMDSDTATTRVGHPDPVALRLIDGGEDRVRVVMLIRELAPTLSLADAVRAFDELQFSLSDLPEAQARAIRDRFTERGARAELTTKAGILHGSGGLPPQLPLDDLATLGLDISGLTVAPLRNSRKIITLAAGVHHA